MSENLHLFTEQDAIWAGVLENALHQRGIPFVKQPVRGAGMAAYVGLAGERYCFYADGDCLEAARAVAEELFSKGGAEPEP